jgi:biotin carboxyl carrier protein
MKMKNEILLTNDKHGIKYVVKKIHISIGDNVTKDQLLIEFE